MSGSGFALIGLMSSMLMRSAADAAVGMPHNTSNGGNCKVSYASG